MGLFGSRKKVYVSSAVYNLAGDITKRPSYVKTAVLNHVISGARSSMAQSIQYALLGGPGITMRRFGRWATNSGYSNSLKITQSNLSNIHENIDAEALTNYISAREDQDVSLQSVEIDEADHTYWAEKFMLEEYPDEFDTAWVADYNEFEKKVYIDRADDAGTVSFHIPEYVQGKKYIYTAYTREDNNLRIWIYPQGGGSAELDAMFDAGIPVGTFYPPIIVRYQNEFLSPTYKGDLYLQGKKAFKKATGGKIEDLVETLKDNESLGDIDHAFVLFGASLNTPSSQAKEYIFKFFNSMFTDYDGGMDEEDWDKFIKEREDSVKTVEDYSGWLAEPIPDDPEPPPTSMAPPTPKKSITIASGRIDIDFSLKIEWKAMFKDTGTGLIKPGARVGQCWIEKGAGVSIDKAVSGKQMLYARLKEDEQTTEIMCQETADSWSKIRIIGLKHINRVYRGKAVEVTGWEALDDPEESGFVVPLHDTLFREMSLVKSSDFATANSYLMLNCYKVVKKKWYQTGIFAVILIVVIIVVSFYYPPAASALSTTFGASAAAAAGLTGLAATVAAVAINAIVAMIVINIMTKAATALFGEKVGAIVGAIAGVMALQMGTAMANGASMASAFSGMMNPVNLMQLANAAGQGYAGYLKASSEELLAQSQQVMEEYEGAMREISTKMLELVGTDSAAIDPLVLLDSTTGMVGAESPDSFLARTLMTGSEVADMSVGLISEFSNITLDTTLV